jgi:hypothetical protein
VEQPLSETDRLFATLRIVLAAMLEALDAPGTEMDEAVADRLAAELRVADAMSPKVAR